MCKKFIEQFCGAVALEDDMMELKKVNREKISLSRNFLRGKHKERVSIKRQRYNLRNPVIQLYSTVYEPVKMDIEIEEEKAAKVRSEQLEELRRKKRKIKKKKRIYWA